MALSVRAFLSNVNARSPVSAGFFDFVMPKVSRSQPVSSFLSCVTTICLGSHAGTLIVTVAVRCAPVLAATVSARLFLAAEGL